MFEIEDENALGVDVRVFEQHAAVGLDTKTIAKRGGRDLVVARFAFSDKRKRIRKTWIAHSKSDSFLNFIEEHFDGLRVAEGFVGPQIEIKIVFASQSYSDLLSPCRERRTFEFCPVF